MSIKLTHDYGLHYQMAAHEVADHLNAGHANDPAGELQLIQMLVAVTPAQIAEQRTRIEDYGDERVARAIFVHEALHAKAGD